MTKVFKVKKNIQELQGENIGLCVDIDCESKDEDDETYHIINNLWKKIRKDTNKTSKTLLKKIIIYLQKKIGIKYELFLMLIVDDHSMWKIAGLRRIV